MTEMPTAIAELTDDELAAAFIDNFGVTEGKARELVAVHRGRAKRDLRLTDPATIADFVHAEPG